MNLRATARLAGVLALLLAACGTPPDATTPAQPAGKPSIAVPTAPPVSSSGPDAPSNGAKPASTVLPDTPSGADATRDTELLKVAESIYEVPVNSMPRLTPDGKKIVFKSSRDGLPQLYIADADKPEGPATRLTMLRERVVEFEITPDGKSVVFLSDKGADENFFIFRIGLDGTGLVQLTKGEILHRDAPVLPDQAPGTMVYSAREVKEKTSRLYVQSTTDGSPPKLVYTDPTPSAFLVDASRDGKQGLLVRLASLSDSKLLLADLGAGTVKPIYPAEGKSENVIGALFSADASTIFIATDGGGEQAILLALDAKTMKEKARYVEAKPATARIEDFAVSKKGDRLALLINAGNRYELRMLDAKTLKPSTAVAMPLGTGGALRFSEDGAQLTLHWSTPSAPLDLYSIDVKTGKAKELRKEPRPTLSRLPEITTTITEVASFDGKKIPLNVYLPRGVDREKKLPTLVIVHGGPAGSYPVRWSLFTRFLSAQGFAIVEPNVRGSTGFGRAYEQADDGPKRMDAVRDLEVVGTWVTKQPWADAERLVVFGGSYGGYMTLMGTAHHPKLWKAGVNLFGIYSWRTFMKTTSGVIRDIFQKEVGSEEDGAFLDSISPVSAVDKIAVPLFVYAGQNDPRVPRSESDQIVASLRTRKISVEYMVADDEGHSLDRKENVTMFLARSTRFLEKTLKIAR